MRTRGTPLAWARRSWPRLGLVASGVFAVSTLVALLITQSPGASLPAAATRPAGPGVGAPIVVPDHPGGGADGSTSTSTATADADAPIRFDGDTAEPDDAEQTADPAARPDDPSTGPLPAPRGPARDAAPPPAGHSSSDGAGTPKEIAGSDAGPKKGDGREQGSTRSQGRGGAK